MRLSDVNKLEKVGRRESTLHQEWLFKPVDPQCEARRPYLTFRCEGAPRFKSGERSFFLSLCRKVLSLPCSIHLAPGHCSEKSFGVLAMNMWHKMKSWKRGSEASVRRGGNLFFFHLGKQKQVHSLSCSKEVSKARRVVILVAESDVKSRLVQEDSSLGVLPNLFDGTGNKRWKA